jgi:hypothetical protein
MPTSARSSLLCAYFLHTAVCRVVGALCLRRSAEAHGALLATTAKDAARLSPAERDGLGLHVLPMELHWLPEAEERLDRLLAPLLAACSGPQACTKAKEHGQACTA